MAKKCVVTVEGGLGKNVMFTAMLKELAKKYEKIYVLSPYFDVFKACPYVTDAFPMGQVSTLYQQLCLSDDCDVLWKEPYTRRIRGYAGSYVRRNGKSDRRRTGDHSGGTHGY